MEPDGIHPRLTRCCSRTHLNVTLCTGRVREDPVSYRPVGLTLVPGNILKIILGNIERHLKEQHYHQVQLTWVHKEKVLFNLFDVLL